MPIKSTEDEAAREVLPATLPELPPGMQEVRSQTVDEFLTNLNRSPLFMTELDETDGDGGTNVDLEALKALAYEGTRAEVGENFKKEGNDLVKLKRWEDARVFYSKSIAVLTAPGDHKSRTAMTDGRLDGGEGPAEVDWLQTDDDALSRADEGGSICGKVIDPEEEENREKNCLEASYVNRALCNLELSRWNPLPFDASSVTRPVRQNYGSVNRDCANAIKLNPKNVKALYRSAQACLALDKVNAAYDACARALSVEPSNRAISNVLTEVEKRKTVLENREQDRIQRERQKKQEALTMQVALKLRNIKVKRTGQAIADMEDAKIGLQDGADAKSLLHVPVLFLYPTAAQSDLVKEASETDTIGAHLDYLLPAPSWDLDGDFRSSENVDCFVDTSKGGLLKTGKKLPLGDILGNENVELQDGLARIYVVPRTKTSTWIAEMKRRNGR